MNDTPNRLNLFKIAKNEDLVNRKLDFLAEGRTSRIFDVKKEGNFISIKGIENELEGVEEKIILRIIFNVSGVENIS